MKKGVDLDDLRAVWKNNVSTHHYSPEEIFAMLKRKSITSVKWIFYISLTEIILGILLSVLILSESGIRNYHEFLTEQYGSGAYLHEALIALTAAANIYFLYAFFKGYNSINSQSSVKSLTLNILAFKNIVHKFVYFNLVVIIFTMCMTILMLILENKLNLDTNKGWIVMLVLVVFCGSMIGLLWLYYYLLYGTFTRRLNNNLQALKEI